MAGTPDTEVLNADSRTGRKARYEAVVDLVEERTSGSRPASVSKMDVLGRLHLRGIGADGMDTALDAALEHGDLLEVLGPDGRPHLVRNRLEDLRAFVTQEADRENPRTDIIGDLNQRIERMQGRR
ncbi:hypothetical protein [Haloarcula laminariae]|uniref:hypothetical protein n=1 Tax=Haloarcula laminariae TaxID=2961577 RepID=UPI0024057CA7|nr:hypothetical protein [Halomicroarcula sp. FL173]